MNRSEIPNQNEKGYKELKEKILEEQAFLDLIKAVSGSPLLKDKTTATLLEIQELGIEIYYYITKTPIEILNQHLEMLKTNKIKKISEMVNELPAGYGIRKKLKQILKNGYEIEI